MMHKDIANILVFSNLIEKLDQGFIVRIFKYIFGQTNYLIGQRFWWPWYTNFFFNFVRAPFW